MFINTKPLHPTFGVIIEDIDLNQVSKNFLYKEIRELFENYSVILFKNQEISDYAHISFAKLFVAMNIIIDVTGLSPRK